MSESCARGAIIRPVPDTVFDTSNLGHFCRWLTHTKGLNFSHYAELWRWSVDELEAFWQALIEYYQLDFGRYDRILSHSKLPPGEWLAGSHVSYPEHILKHRGDACALIGISQTRERCELSRDALRDQVARCAEGLRQRGVKQGDRVAAYLPNIPEAIVAFLATASIGAIWVSCAPEFGVKAVVDRLTQVKPKLLIAVAAYNYGGKNGHKTIDRRAHVEQICQAVDSITQLIDVPYHPDFELEHAETWHGLLSEWQALSFFKARFDHPLYILFSSGTSGLPKAIVHGHGGILLEHTKALGLHNDLRDGDTFFWFSTTGWMVWNYSVSALLSGASVLCFDGNPMAPEPDSLWALAAEEKVSYFGNSASFYMSSLNAELQPKRDFALDTIRTLGSTGSPLPSAGFTWLANEFGEDVVIASVAGGTDICSAFLGASPMVPIRAGELAAPMLGCEVLALNEHGHAVLGEAGELVVTTPMPSMPVMFWNDPDNQRYHAAYFEANPGKWTHGDWIILYEDGASVITGRSDSTLNRGGVRLGTADFYDLVEALPQIEDSLVIHLEDNDGGLGQLILFLVLAAKADGDAVKASVKQHLRDDLSPRHVPDDIALISAIPRTLTGKKIEKPIKRILQGAAINDVANPESLRHPEAIHEILAWFEQQGSNTRSNKPPQAAPIKTNPA